MTDVQPPVNDSTSIETSRRDDAFKPLPITHEHYVLAHDWLINEAYLLDAMRYGEWLDLLTADVRYVMPVSVTTAKADRAGTRAGIDHFSETKGSLSRRVARFETEHAWAEDPPSRIRHFVTNVRVSGASNASELFIESYLLLFRSRGDVNESALISARREDILRNEGHAWRLARRHIDVDESVIRMQNLALFL